MGRGVWFGCLGCRGLRSPCSPSLTRLACLGCFPGPFTFFCLPCLLFSFLDFTSARVRVRGFLVFVFLFRRSVRWDTLDGQYPSTTFCSHGIDGQQMFFGVAGPSTTSVDSGLSRWLCHAGGFLSNALKAGSRKAGVFHPLMSRAFDRTQCCWCIFHVTRGILLWKLLSFRLQVIFRLQVFGKLAPCL